LAYTTACSLYYRTSRDYGKRPKTLSHRNLFCKYADDTNLILPGNSDIGLNEEFINIENWPRANKMIINFSKTKGVVFRRPGLTHFINPPPINNFEQVDVDITIFKMAAVRHFGFVVTSQYCTRGHVHFLCPKCRSKISC